jgi:DNA polymerase I-like protein with 3'-5' exonuclease and polymerase domains
MESVKALLAILKTLKLIIMTFEQMKALPPNEQKVLFQKLKDSRSMAKTVNYSAIYGVGAAKMHLSTGMPIEQCKLLLKAYWKRNWSVKQIAKECVVKTLTNGEMWLYNPVSRFWYSLRYQKDRFSTLNQGTAVYIFDTWIRKNRQEGIEICGQFHDEIIVSTPVENEKGVRYILRESIIEINNEFKLNRDMDIDVQFGLSYSDIH